jgi:hypothetical protein
MESKNVIGQAQLELLHVFSFPFVAGELTPRLKEVFERDDAFVSDVELGLSQTV